MKILIIEDTPIIVETISLCLEMVWPDARVISTGQGAQGIDLVESESPDVVILDIGLPDISGFDVLKQIRLFSDVPILILTVRSNEADIIRGLDWGADDYITKPFKKLELIARIKGVMRRGNRKYEKPLSCGQIRFEPDSLRLMRGPEEIKISRTEGIILRLLMRNSGKVTSYSSLAREMWGDDFPEAKSSIQVHIRHLREKIEDDPGKPEFIRTKTGLGYIFAACQELA